MSKARDLAMEMRDIANDLVREIVDLHAELREAQSEIGRHHIDFEKIRRLLDAFDEGRKDYEVIMQIRGIVG